MSDLISRLNEMSNDMIGPYRRLTIEAAAEIERLRKALEPFAEVARRLGWDKLRDDDPQRNEHIIEAPADDIANGTVYCLQVSEFASAADAYQQTQEPEK